MLPPVSGQINVHNSDMQMKYNEATHSMVHIEENHYMFMHIYINERVTISSFNVIDPTKITLEKKKYINRC